MTINIVNIFTTVFIQHRIGISILTTTIGKLVFSVVTYQNTMILILICNLNVHCFGTASKGFQQVLNLPRAGISNLLSRDSS